ncbi:MAG: PilN domain-containing protein [Gammaproteobacteria bacterium]|nr:PilN domain-containing protein [Gammaproteobacteria bacterium]MDH3429237.1 PilN domain-containing protein [Gammaproteobacteria bacterium]MDH3433232.1 PilN domain-containing protein [Gammaproteobacteria bacterium]
MNVDIARSLQPLRVRYAAPLKRRFDEFWSWWSAELLGLLPQDMRNAIAQRNQRLFITVDDRVMVVRQGTSARSREVQRIDRDAPAGMAVSLSTDARDRVLLLPRDKVLSTPITLPLAAEENLHEVLAFEMDKHTPFSADKIYYDFVVTGRDAHKQRLSVELVYSPRAIVNDILETVARQDMSPNVVTIHDDTIADLLPVNLLPEEMRRSRRQANFRLNAGLAILCGVLIITAAALPLLQKYRLIQELEPQLQEAAATAQQGSQLRDDVAMLAAGTRYLEQKKQSNLMVVQLIDEVSRILPDDTWISRLDIADDELQLQGQSSSSAALIAIVESSSLLHNARFRSPVVQIPGTGEERFHLSADIAWSLEQ